jgi:hypothetical protein
VRNGSGCARDANGVPVRSRWFGQSAFGEYTLATERTMVKADQDLPLNCSDRRGAVSGPAPPIRITPDMT